MANDAVRAQHIKPRLDVCEKQIAQYKSTQTFEVLTKIESLMEKALTLMGEDSSNIKLFCNPEGSFPWVTGVGHEALVLIDMFHDWVVYKSKSPDFVSAINRVSMDILTHVDSVKRVTPVDEKAPLINLTNMIPSGQYEAAVEMADFLSRKMFSSAVELVYAAHVASWALYEIASKEVFDEKDRIRARSHKAPNPVITQEYDKTQLDLCTRVLLRHRQTTDLEHA